MSVAMMLIAGVILVVIIGVIIVAGNRGE